MTLNPLAGRPPLSSGASMASPSLTAPTDGDQPPELLLAIIAEREKERKKNEWAAWADSEYTKCRNSRHAFERQWYINLAFTAGKQYVSPLDVPGYGFRLTTPKAPPWRVRIVVNKIRTAVRTECSKLTTSKPIPTVMPSTNEDEDYSAASVAEQILKSKFATAEFESIYRSWIWWGVVCGVSFLKLYWDPTSPDYDSKQLPPPPMIPGPKGEPVPIPEQLLEQIPELKARMQIPVPAQGKICIERITPFHVYVPDLLCESLEDQPYIIQVMTKSPLWVESKFGFKPNADARASNTILDAATIIAKGAEDHLDSVLVKEIWIKPGGHSDFPEGGVLTVINNKVVQVRDKWPYPFNQYPFYKYNGVPTGGFYSDSTVVDLIPIQKEYNKKRSQAIEIQNTMGKPKLLYPRGSINPKMISSEPGQSIPYTPGYDAPTELQGSEVPTSFIQEIEKLREEFDDISGQHEISRGQTTVSNLTSGTAIAYLQEQDDAKLNYQVASIENATEMFGTHYLVMASHYWDDNRIVKTTGKNNTFEALHWKKGMLKGNTDVKVQTGSALPFSKAAKQALLTEMMQNGYITPETGLEMMNLGGMDKAIDDMLIDKRQVIRENLKMAEIPESMLKLLLEPAPGPNGEPPFDGPPDPFTGEPQRFNGDGSPFEPQPPIPVNSWDDHEQHIQWHNQYRKSQEFELLPELNKKAFELHVQTHEMALQSQMVGFGGNVVQDNSGMGGGMGGGMEQGMESEQGFSGGPDTQQEQPM